MQRPRCVPAAVGSCRSGTDASSVRGSSSISACGQPALVNSLTQKCDMTFTSMMRTMSSGGRSWNDIRGTIPALLTRMSTVPKSRFTFAYSSTTSSYLLTSAWDGKREGCYMEKELHCTLTLYANAFCPMDLITFAIIFAASKSMSTTAT